MTTPTPSTFPCAAEAVVAQQTRQDRLDELYAQDGRQSPDHPMHGLYSGLVALPPLPGSGGAPQAAPGPTLWRRVFEAMAAADERAWGHPDAIGEQHGREAALAERLALADRQAAEAMLTTIRRELVNHLHSRSISTAAQIVGGWFDQQIADARKGE